MALPPTGYRKPAPTPQPLSEERGDRARVPYPLGAWVGDKFAFASPEAEKQWQADSFLQGSHHLLWMKGRRLRPEENTLAGMGLPPSDDVYQGPDGQRYQTTLASREDPHMAMLRAAHLAAEPPQGSATEMGQRASEKALPQAMAMMAQGARVEARPPAANDNRAAANENQPPAPATAAPQGVGRFAAMAQATKDPASQGPTLAEIGQDVADTIRLTANAVTLDNADKLSAAANAVGSALAGGNYGETYRNNLTAEQQETEAARKRMGLIGAIEEVAPTLIPGYGDVLGVAGDLKMYRDHPEERTWKNYGMTALGALPFIPSVAGSIKKVDRALDAAEDGAKAVAKEGKTLSENVEAVGDLKAEVAVPKDASGGKAAVPDASFSKNYPKTFFTAYPELKGRVTVHRAIEHQVLNNYPGLFTEAEIFALDNLRGIPNELNSTLHLREIRMEWNQFYRQHENPTKEQFLEKVADIDRKLGHQFMPTRGDKR